MTPSFPYLWLLLGGVLQAFGSGKLIVPLAAWLAPVFLLHVMRGRKPIGGVLWVWPVLIVALSVSNRGVIPLQGAAYFGLVAAMSAPLVLAFMDDFAAQDNVMAAQVPIAAGVRTIYAWVGDLFAWLCVTSLLGGIGWGVILPSGRIEARS